MAKRELAGFSLSRLDVNAEIKLWLSGGPLKNPSASILVTSTTLTTTVEGIVKKLKVQG